MALGFVCLVSAGHTADKESSSRLPDEVSQFMERRNLCEHFLGEEPYDEERRKFLMKNLKKYCTGTDKELSSVRNKYKNNEAVLNALAGYEDNIE